jgi:hypothetical protein
MQFTLLLVKDAKEAVMTQREWEMDFETELEDEWEVVKK